MIVRNRDFYSELLYTGHKSISSSMYCKDSTQRLPLADNSIDLIITSPPYVTSYDYADLHQLSILWLSGDTDYFKQWKKFVGANFKRNKCLQFDREIAEKIISDLKSNNNSLSMDIANYFSDMRSAFGEMHRVLKPNGKICIIIGNTNMNGIEILNAEVAAEQMYRVGFRKVEFIKRLISNKLIAPWRDAKTGKFTTLSNPFKKRIYEHEYVVVMKK
ncbi:site-specific DNA-methyltransferase [Candidatus Berkiella cookevillensis]|uniref:site-specific DNA-methyltransferase (cytosine-N(4)-specific) n=1 Tax=Candidatus Berkiella cookevillensis TaxID=437022 RepID=A0A0Q9YMQ3_9GAMM|nr:DNA methyltransferase [Candidatus Berkiella cookevillensis]MCS5707339.1 site-specific DNA-methyltransferase [Candidatus Berkiella cookevillensis]